MLNNENIINQLQELLHLPKNFSILEEQIDVGLQIEYFEYSKKIRERQHELKKNQFNAADENIFFDIRNALDNKDKLFEKGFPLEGKKELLTCLASLEEVAAYRAIERYAKEADAGLKQWSVLALQESRMLIENNLLNESQVFISTGLGGKGTKLRYFVVLTSKTGKPFNPTQRKVIKSEFEFALEKNDSELEEFDFEENIAMLLVVMPLDAPLQDIFKGALEECNELGDFISPNFIVTNVKRLSVDEIKQFINDQNNPIDESEDDLGAN